MHSLSVFKMVCKYTILQHEEKLQKNFITQHDTDTCRIFFSPKTADLSSRDFLIKLSMEVTDSASCEIIGISYGISPIEWWESKAVLVAFITSNSETITVFFQIWYLYMLVYICRTYHTPVKLNVSLSYSESLRDHAKTKLLKNQPRTKAGKVTDNSQIIFKRKGKENASNEKERQFSNQAELGS